jgi:ABC-2 type transport system permease protein
LWAKFAYATTVTIAAGLLVTTVSIRSLDVHGWLAGAQLAITASVCVGLCGCAIGFGACWPVFGERNAARIASGFGGTINLILSVVLVVASLATTAITGFYARTGSGGIDARAGLALLVVVATFNVVAAIAAMTAGIRRFNRLEF